MSGPCATVLWGAKDGYKFTNWYCGEVAKTKYGEEWYCPRHIKEGQTAQARERADLLERAAALVGGEGLT